MNDKNNALFFNEDNDFNAVITLTDEDGNDMDMEAVAALEIHELGKEYIAVVPTEPNDEFEDGEVWKEFDTTANRAAICHPKSQTAKQTICHHQHSDRR